MVGLSVLLGICGGSWALTQWLSSTIQSQIRTRTTLAAEIETQRATLQQLQDQTWGVRFHEGDNGRFLVLPSGTMPDTGWTVGERSAVKLLRK